MQEALWEITTSIVRKAASSMKNREWVKCKYCGSTNVVKFGTSGGVQRWWRKDCQRKFIDNDALPRMQTPVNQIGAVLSMYYGGMSLGEIRRHCEQQYGTFPSRSTLYRWLSKFSRIAINEAKKYTPKVGDIWVADETVLKVEGKKLDRLKKVCGSGT